jgi:glycosyltransferase involved in cell wall biosynthesis
MVNNDLISIITATFNRSNVLKYSIQSAIDQSYENWELLIIGDCCTDDTENVVNSFNNPKIKFINLEKNIGEQSGPNNFGMKICNGKYISFLNQDDLWFPNHLELLYNKLIETGSDLSYSLFYPAQVNNTVFDMPIRINSSHDLIYASPASSWLFQKKLYNDIGGWKYFKEIYDMPSQEWLSRAYKRSKKISIVNEVTLIAVQSGARINSYKNRDCMESEYYYNAIKKNPDKLLKEIFFAQIVHLTKRDRNIFYHLRAFFRNIIRLLLNNMGLKIYVIRLIFFHRKKGGLINQLRQNRGLTKI